MQGKTSGWPSPRPGGPEGGRDDADDPRDRAVGGGTARGARGVFEPLNGPEVWRPSTGLTALSEGPFRMR